MTNTELLHCIRTELKQQEVVWKTEQELFELLLPNEDWKSYKTKWSSWRRKKNGSFGVHYLRKSPHILANISKRLGFSVLVWEMANDVLQKEAIQKGIASSFADKSKLLDLSRLFPSYTLSTTQSQLLEHVESQALSRAIELLSAYPHYFQAKMLNQPFLLGLINKLYAKGAFVFLVDRVFPLLVSSNRGKDEVKILEAHCLSSLPEPKYLQTVELLQSIKTKNSKELIDLHTSAISNFRRHKITHENLNIEELKEGISILIKSYHHLYQQDKLYNYYPAVHLFYALVLGKALGLDEGNMDMNELYHNAQPSIKEDMALTDRHSQYYAKMSNFEMQILLGREHAPRDVGFFLEQEQPHPSLVFRTKRQMVEYVALIERLNLKLNIADSFKALIVLFNDYERDRDER